MLFEVLHYYKPILLKNGKSGKRKEKKVEKGNAVEEWLNEIGRALVSLLADFTIRCGML